MVNNYSGIIALILYIFALAVFLRHEAGNTSADDVSKLNLDDEEAMVASLIASIECRKKYKKNVRVISVRKVG